MSFQTHGKGHTHQKRHSKKKEVINELIFINENEGEFYAQIAKPLGSGQFNVLDNEGRELRASITRSFCKGPSKEFVNIGDYVKVQPGISKNQFFINHKYSKNDVDKLYSLGHIGKPKNDNTIEESDLVFDQETNEESTEQLTMDDIWNDL